MAVGMWSYGGSELLSRAPSPPTPRQPERECTQFFPESAAHYSCVGVGDAIDLFGDAQAEMQMSAAERLQHRQQRQAERLQRQRDCEASVARADRVRAANLRACMATANSPRHV